MPIEMMRDCIARAYPGDDWKKKVKNMPNNQVIAIYYRLLAQGKLS